MPGRRRCRRVAFQPNFEYFKPAGVRSKDLESVEIGMDEFEAMRLKDYLELDQSEAAFEMGISQPTFHRMLVETRKKVARALIEGLLLRVEKKNQTVITEGGNARIFGCFDCGHSWSIDYGISRPTGCPMCGSPLLKRVEEEWQNARE